MARQNDNGHWGRAFYSPKWISTHYTLLDLRNLCIESQPSITKTINILFDDCINAQAKQPSRKTVSGDVCVNGMFLNYAAYFGADEENLKNTIDYLLCEQMPDGGFNCDYRRHNATHSSLHTTLSVTGRHDGISEKWLFI